MKLLLASLLSAIMLAARIAHAQDTVYYCLSYDGGGRVHVRLILPPPGNGPQILVMPRAIPMGYGEQHYDRFVDRVQAFSSNGEPLPVRREDGPRWRLGDESKGVRRIEYEVDVLRMETEILSAADTSRSWSQTIGPSS